MGEVAGTAMWMDLINTVTDAGGLYALLGVVLLELRIIRSLVRTNTDRIGVLEVRVGRIERREQERAT